MAGFTVDEQQEEEEEDEDEEGQDECPTVTRGYEKRGFIGGGGGKDNLGDGVDEGNESC